MIPLQRVVPIWSEISYYWVSIDPSTITDKGKVQKKSKKETNNSAFSATHTYIKLTLVSFFYFFFYAPFP